jgi:3-methyladenine DNA glycosylase AlkD
MEKLINSIKKIKHGFKHIIETGDKILLNKKENHLQLATNLLNDESYQARMLATYILGELATNNPIALKILKTKVSKDENWRVQEMLAKAFDNYCMTFGYENSLVTIEKWLTDKNPNVKRAVVEGFRIWTNRPYFKANPEKAIALISRHKADDSEYLRMSVGNALRDISKKHSELIANEMATWDLQNPKIKFTCKFVTKNG